MLKRLGALLSKRMVFIICTVPLPTDGDFIRPFIAIHRDPKDTPILLGRPALKEYRIILDNENMEWEFKRKAKVQEYSSKRFQQLLRKSSSNMYIIQPYLRLPELSNTTTTSSPDHQQRLIRVQQLKQSLACPYGFDKINTEIDKPSSPDLLHLDSNSLSPHFASIPEWIRDKYADVFDAHNAKILSAHKQTDHAIDLMPDAATAISTSL
jgi:hypothetical protein